MVLAPLELNPARIGTQPTGNDWLDSLRPIAEKYSQQTGIPAEVFLAINASETNYGQAGSLFGIKGSGSAGSANYATHEVVNGQSVPQNDNFAVYNKPEDAYKDFIDLVSTSPRYASAWQQAQSGNWQGFLSGINTAGYATDPNWAHMISGLANNISSGQVPVIPLQGGSASSSVLPAAQAGAIARMNFPSAAPAMDTSATATAQPLQSTQPAFTPAATQPMVGGEAVASVAPAAQAAQIASAPVTPVQPLSPVSSFSYTSNDQSAKEAIGLAPTPEAKAYIQNAYDQAVQLGKDPLADVQAAYKEVTQGNTTAVGPLALTPKQAAIQYGPALAIGAVTGGVGAGLLLGAGQLASEGADAGLPQTDNPLLKPVRRAAVLAPEFAAGPGSAVSKTVQLGATVAGGEATSAAGLGRGSGELIGGGIPAVKEGITSILERRAAGTVANVVEEGAGSVKPPARPLDQLIEHVQAAGSARPDLVAAQSAEKARRLAMMMEDLRAGGAPASELLDRAQQKLKGPLADKTFAMPSAAMDFESLHQDIVDAALQNKVDGWTALNAKDALKSLQSGVIPEPNEIESLGKVFGPELQGAINDLGDAFKVKRLVTERFTGRGEVPITPGPNGELSAANITDAVSSMLPKAAAGNSKAIQTAVQSLINEERLVATVGADGKTVLRLKGPQFDALGETVRGLGYTPEPTPVQSRPPTQDQLGLETPVMSDAEREAMNARHRVRQDAARASIDIPEPATPPRELTMEEYQAARAASAAPASERMIFEEAYQWQQAHPTERLDPLTVNRRNDLEAVALNESDRQRRATANGEQLGFGDGAALPPPRNPASGAQGSFSDWSPGQPLWRKAGNAVLETFGLLPRALQTAFDYSYPLRQGALLGVRHEKEFWSAFGKGLRALVDPEFAAAKQAEILKRPYNPPNLDLTDWRPGEKLTDMEEGFMSRLADHIPVVGHIIRASNRAATVFINDLRSGVTNTFARTQLRYGRSLSDLAPDLEAYANYVNRATGRGNLGQFESSLPALNQVFYGLRRNVAMVQAPGYLFHSSPAVRKEAMLDMVAFVGVGAATLKLAQLAGADVGMVPGTADFGKIRVGNTRVDIWGGYQQLAGVITKVIQGQIANPGSSEEFASAVLPFISNKLAPGPNFAINQSDKLRAAFQPGQKKQTLEQAAVNSATPLAASGLIDAIKEDGAEGGALALTGFFGTGTQSYTAKSDIGAGDVRDAVQFGAVSVKTYLDPAGNPHPIETLSDLKAASPLAYDQFLKDHPAVAGSLADADSPTQHQVRQLQDELYARQQLRDAETLKSDPAKWRADSSDDARTTAARIDGIMSTQGDFKGEPTTLLAAAQKQYHDLIDSNTDKKSTNVNWDAVDRGVAQMSPDAQKLLFESSLKGETDARKQYLTDIKQLEPYFKQRDSAWGEITAKRPDLQAFTTFDDYQQSIVDKFMSRGLAHSQAESMAQAALQPISDIISARTSGYLAKNRSLVPVLDKWGFYIPTALQPLAQQR